MFVLAFRRTYGVRQEASTGLAACTLPQARMPTLPKAYTRRRTGPEACRYLSAIEGDGKGKKGSLKYRSASIVQDTSNEREHRRFPIQTRSSCLRTPRTYLIAQQIAPPLGGFVTWNWDGLFPYKQNLLFLHHRGSPPRRACGKGAHSRIRRLWAPEG